MLHDESDESDKYNESGGEQKKTTTRGWSVMSVAAMLFTLQTSS